MTNKNKQQDEAAWIDANNNDQQPSQYQYKLDTLPRSFTEMAKSFRESGGDQHDGKTSIIRKINWNHYGMMVVLFSILLVSMVWLVRHDSKKCTIDQKMVDTCLKRLMFFSNDQDQHFPTTDKQLDRYCKEKADSIKCLRHFVEGCLDAGNRELRYFKKFYLNYKYQLDKTCLRRTERQKFIDYAECLSKNDLLRNVSDCNKNIHYQLFYIAQNLKGKQRLLAGCCAYNQRNECFDRKISNSCPRSVRDFVLERIESPFRTIMESICPADYSTIGGCEHSLPASVWQKIFAQPESLRLEMSDEIGLQPNLINSSQNVNGSIYLTMANNITHARNENLSFKMIQLKFYENFLGFFMVFRPDD